MAKGLFIMVGMTGLVAVSVGGRMSNDPAPITEPQRATLELEAPEANDASNDMAIQAGTVQLERSGDGHFYADVKVNGATVHALVDTGASAIALSRDDARSAGIATSIGMPNVVGQGADGDVFGELVTIDNVSLGHKRVEGMQAMVLNSGQQTLLGQSFLSKFESVEIRGDRMILR